MGPLSRVVHTGSAGRPSCSPPSYTTHETPLTTSAPVGTMPARIDDTNLSSSALLCVRLTYMPVGAR
jgi:hypothetical protein